MAYRRPGIEVIQEFQALSPALVLPTLPACVVGPAFQVEDDVTTATVYDGTLTDYAYPDLEVGAVVDLAELDTDEPSAIQKPISVTLKTAYVTKASASDGTSLANDQTYTTVAASFANVTLSSTVQYFLELDNADSDDGKHLITAKTSNTEVELADELQNAIAGTSVYKVLLKQTELTYDRANFSTVGIVQSATGVQLPADLPSDETNATSDPVSEAADVELSYRAIRPDMADQLDVYTDLDSLEAIFGVGNVVPSNPYAYGVNVALNNTTTEINATGLRATYFTDEQAAYQTALEYLESVDVYGIVVLTQDATVHQYLSTHVTGQSASSVGRERIGFVNNKLDSKEIVVPTAGVGSVTAAGVGHGTSTNALNNDTFKDITNGNFILDGVSVGEYLEVSAYTYVYATFGGPSVANAGDSIATGAGFSTIVLNDSIFVAADVGRMLRIASATNPVNDGDWVIASYISGTSVTVTDTSGTMVNETGPSFISTVVSAPLTAAQMAYITGTRHAISAVVSNTELTFAADLTSGNEGTLEDLVYQITDDLTLSEEATLLSGYASSYANRRLVSVWSDTCYATVSGTATELPGYFLGCALCAMTAGLPSQQGFTNLSLTGFTALQNSSDRYNDTQLDTIAGGGNLIVLQDVTNAPVYVRHQLTTDTSTIQFQELSVTKNVDLVARFFRELYKPYIGKYNITDALLDILKSITVSGIEFLKEQKAPRVGGVLRDGSISSLAEDTTQVDTVNIVLDINIPYPLNNIKLTLLV